jgi:dihydrodipicolinate synthase/N-acetylneuraminate lyase
MNWSGVMPAMTTTFTPDMKVDYPFLAQHAAWQLGNGCEGLVMLGSLGEGATLEHAEKIDILKTAVRVAGKLPVVLHLRALHRQRRPARQGSRRPRLLRPHGPPALRLHLRLV